MNFQYIYDIILKNFKIFKSWFNLCVPMSQSVIYLRVERITTVLFNWSKAKKEWVYILNGW